jgi:hypothetical protein
MTRFDFSILFKNFGHQTVFIGEWGTKFNFFRFFEFFGPQIVKND